MQKSNFFIQIHKSIKYLKKTGYASTQLRNLWFFFHPSNIEKDHSSRCDISNCCSCIYQQSSLNKWPINNRANYFYNLNIESAVAQGWQQWIFVEFIKVLKNGELKEMYIYRTIQLRIWSRATAARHQNVNVKCLTWNWISLQCLTLD